MPSLEQDSGEAEAIEVNPEGLEMNVYSPESNIILRPSADINTIKFIFVISGSIIFSSGVPKSVAETAAPRVRYNRDSLRAAVIGIFRHGLSFMTRRLHADAVGQEAFSDSDASDFQATHQQQANAGHTIYVLPQACRENSSSQISPSSVPGKATADSTCTVIGDAKSQVNMWPVDRSEAVVLADKNDPCWLVEVCVPCSEIPISQSSINQLRERAILQATSKMCAGP